jgi:hypothetical protein
MADGYVNIGGMALKAVDNGDGTFSLVTKGAGDTGLACATPIEYNVTLTLANTEYSQALPAGTRKVVFRCRSAADVRYAWVTGKVAGLTAPYQTLKTGAEYATDGINLTGRTLYLASASAGVVVEIEAWQ